MDDNVYRLRFPSRPFPPLFLLSLFSSLPSHFFFLPFPIPCFPSPFSFPSPLSVSLSFSFFFYTFSSIHFHLFRLPSFPLFLSLFSSPVKYTHAADFSGNRWLLRFLLFCNRLSNNSITCGLAIIVFVTGSFQ